MIKILCDDIIDDDIYLYGKYLCNLSVYKRPQILYCKFQVSVTSSV